MTQSTGDSAQRARPSLLADARTSMGDLVLLVVGESRMAQLGWAAEIALVAATNLLILRSVNQALGAKPNTFAPLGAMLSFGLGVALQWWMLRRLSRRVLESMNQGVSAITKRILSAMGRLDLEQFESVGRDQIMARLSSDASRIVPSSNVLIQLLVSAVTVGLSTFYVATLSPAAALLSLLGMIGIALVTLRINQQVMEQIRRDQAIQRRMQEPIDDLLSGFKQLKQHHPRSEAVAMSFDHAAHELQVSRDSYHAAFYARDTLGRQAFFGLLGATSFLLPLVVPEVASQVGQLMVSITFIFRPVTTVVMTIPILAQIGSAWQRLAALSVRLDSMASVTAESGVTPRSFSQLTLRKVTFQYPRLGEGDSFSVGPLTLELLPGEVVFVTGANGSGKSTFVKLLCGLYRRHGGDLLVDGVVHPVDPGPGWRSRFATVFAEFALFEQLYGMEDIAPAQVEALLVQMELAHKVRFENGRFSTVELSTGQRKRLALVIALLSDRPIYVFDEWAADQDPHFREAFYRRFLPELKALGKTVVAVTHDDDAFDACDRRFHFEGGHMEQVAK